MSETKITISEIMKDRHPQTESERCYHALLAAADKTLKNIRNNLGRHKIVTSSIVEHMATCYAILNAAERALRDETENHPAVNLFRHVFGKDSPSGVAYHIDVSVTIVLSNDRRQSFVDVKPGWPKAKITELARDADDETNAS